MNLVAPKFAASHPFVICLDVTLENKNGDLNKNDAPTCSRTSKLADFGVSGKPENDNWQVTKPVCGSPAVACGGETEITATGLDPCVRNMTGCTRESAILISLPPGPYTAHVSAAGGAE